MVSLGLEAMHQYYLTIIVVRKSVILEKGIFDI